MKTSPIIAARRLLRLGFLAFALGIFIASPARAGLTVDIHLYHNTYGYYFYPWLNVNTNTPDFPTGDYMIASPQIPTGGSQLQYQATNNTLNFITGGGNYYGDFDSFLYGITNGQWSIWVTNSTATNQYQFTVTVTGVTSNSFGAPVVAVFPTDGAINVTNQPLFQWTGPVNWAGTLSVNDNFIDANGDYNYEASADLPPDQTSWPCPVTLPNGTNDFSADYSSNVTAMIIAATPTNGSAQPISGWISTATMESYFTFDPQFTVGSTTSGNFGGGHTLAAHYDFDDSGDLGHDSSGHGNDMAGEVYWGPQHEFDTDAEAGDGAVRFFGTDAMFAYDETLTNLNAVLAGSFTFSAWVKTTVTNGEDYNNAFFGAVIFWADNDQQGDTNDTIPLSITGSKAAFTTRGSDSGASDNLHSLTSVNDGNYHLITVTRDQATGEKKIYVDGQFEASEISTTEPLNGNNYNLTIGGEGYILETTSTVTNYSSYKGLLDDVQIYTGVLSAAEVASQFANPGATIPDVAGNSASGLVAHYDFDEGTALAADVSGNGNNIIVAGNIDDYDGDNPVISNDTISGAGSVSFDGYGFLTPPADLLSTIAGTFSLSLWVKTMDDSGNQGDPAWAGDCIVSADSPDFDLENGDIIPVALTGGQVAFNTGSPENGDQTLNSSALVNNGQWHHIVVMRNQPTGEKDIYIDGELDAYGYDTTRLLTDPQLLTIGCKSDATDPDPTSPDGNGSNGYEGLLDDIQIYNRVLSSDEVAFLYNNPGSTLSTSTTNTPYPVDVSLHLTISRSQDPYWGEYFSAGVSFDSVSPSPTTTNSVHSPHDYFSTETYPAGGSGSGAILYSLGDVLNELTNGFWKIYINQGSPTQEVYSFQVSFSGIDTNLLTAAKILYPTNGSANVLANAAFYWTGPTNFSTLAVGLFTGPDTYISLPLTTTNWTPSQAMTNGSQTFFVSYDSNDFPDATFTTPVDASLNPIDSWSTRVTLNAEAFSSFTVVASAPLPVQLTNLQNTGGNFQFSLASQAGYTNTIQYRTNLTLGAWLTYSNITGDGTLKNASVPVSIFNGSKQGFLRVSTQ